jgi:hypothetical protein
MTDFVGKFAGCKSNPKESPIKYVKFKDPDDPKIRRIHFVSEIDNEEKGRNDKKLESIIYFVSFKFGSPLIRYSLRRKFRICISSRYVLHLTLAQQSCRENCWV